MRIFDLDMLSNVCTVFYYCFLSCLEDCDVYANAVTLCGDAYPVNKVAISVGVANAIGAPIIIAIIVVVRILFRRRSK